MSTKKLPDAEFEIMKAIWNSAEPVTSPSLTERLRVLLPHKDWKPQTVLTMLVRLEKKGFLRSEKNSKERHYYSIISENEYLKIEHDSFKKRFSGRSLSGLVKALYDGESIPDEEVQELKDWINGME